MINVIKSYFKSIWFEFVLILEDIRDKNWDKHSGLWFSLYRFRRELVYPLRFAKYGVQNLFAYFKIIWFDRDWDYYFIESLLLFKLKRTRNHIAKHQNHVDWEKTVKSIDFVIKALERIHADTYREKAEKELEEKYGELTTSSVAFTHDKNGNPLTYQLVFNRSKCETEEELEKADEEFRKIYNLKEKDIQRDYRLAFKVMAKYIQSWWD